jgi:transglutaminase-like putative cysteine protease
MKIRLGYELVFDCPKPTPIILTLKVHSTRVQDLVFPDSMAADTPIPIAIYFDSYGNQCARIVAPQGNLRLSTDTVINDSGLPDPTNQQAQQTAVEQLPYETLLFLLGSRYCETDPLVDTAWQLFSNNVTGWSRVQAICNYIHHHIEFGYHHARSTRTAMEVLQEK